MLKYYREGELMNGRWAMAAVAGILFTDLVSEPGGAQALLLPVGQGRLRHRGRAGQPVPPGQGSAGQRRAAQGSAGQRRAGSVMDTGSCCAGPARCPPYFIFSTEAAIRLLPLNQVPALAHSPTPIPPAPPPSPAGAPPPRPRRWVWAATGGRRAPTWSPPST